MKVITVYYRKTNACISSTSLLTCDWVKRNCCQFLQI